MGVLEQRPQAARKPGHGLRARPLALREPKRARSGAVGPPALGLVRKLWPVIEQAIKIGPRRGRARIYELAARNGTMLTPRQRMVILARADGKGLDAIAAEMKITLNWAAKLERMAVRNILKARGTQNGA